ncbi:MAG: DUF362 domain-containing protein [Armatimonadota bacterium]|nr:DUF362 domain-containing protein [Armatimonadota bacterium]MDW8025815.1 DUF362 domain-containing protein [Armatimonadota bacterium]
MGNERFEHLQGEDAFGSESRREFIRNLTNLCVGGLACLLGLGQSTGATKMPPQGRVIIVRSKRPFKAPLRPDKDELEKMLDRGMIALTGEPTAQRAWEKLFSSDERVGIKPNGLGGPTCSTSKELIEVCIERLTGIGIKAENIYLWDQNPSFIRNWGFDVRPKGPGVRVLNVQETFGDVVKHGTFRGRITRIITHHVDAIINMPILKDHNIAGVTAALKNHYGSIDNPAAHHANGCDPYIAHLNSFPHIKQKTRLIIGDALRPLCEGGPQDRPQFRWVYGGVILSCDPVAHDAVALRIIEERRKEVGLPPLESVGRPARHIATAAKLGLGVADPKKLQLVMLNI